MTLRRLFACRFAALGLGLAACWLPGMAMGQVSPAGHITPAAQYFGGARAYQPVVQAGYNAPAPQPVQLTGTKPFQNAELGSPISPYLSLDLPATSTSLPNFYAYVQPQQQQRARLEQQTQELRRLQQQLRVATARGIVSKNPTAGMPTTGSSSQFMNLGGYYQTNTVR
jgi:hypothetical protein